MDEHLGYDDPSIEDSLQICKEISVKQRAARSRSYVPDKDTFKEIDNIIAENNGNTASENADISELEDFSFGNDFIKNAPRIDAEGNQIKGPGINSQRTNSNNSPQMRQANNVRMHQKNVNSDTLNAQNSNKGMSGNAMPTSMQSANYNRMQGDGMHTNKPHGNQMHGNQMQGNKMHSNQQQGKQMRGNQTQNNHMQGNQMHINQIQGNAMQTNGMPYNQQQGNQMHEGQMPIDKMSVAGVNSSNTNTIPEKQSINPNNISRENINNQHTNRMDHVDKKVQTNGPRMDQLEPKPLSNMPRMDQVDVVPKKRMPKAEPEYQNMQDFVKPTREERKAFDTAELVLPFAKEPESLKPYDDSDVVEQPFRKNVKKKKPTKEEKAVLKAAIQKKKQEEKRKAKEAAAKKRAEMKKITKQELRMEKLTDQMPASDVGFSIRNGEDGDEYSESHPFLRSLLGVLICVVAALLLSLFITKFIAHHTSVEGSSMETTLKNEDQIIVENFSYYFSDPERFDVVVFPFNDNVNYIKRIIGLPGETVQIQNGNIYINGKLLEESYGTEVMSDPGLARRPITLGPDEYFVLGDNRNASVDSRKAEVRNVKRDKIIGKAWFILYPFSRFSQIE